MDSYSMMFVIYVVVIVVSEGRVIFNKSQNTKSHLSRISANLVSFD